MNTEVLTVSVTLNVRPFPDDVQNITGAEKLHPPIGDEVIRARLADVVRQAEKRRRLSAFLEKETPAWNPDDHPDIDAAGGAAAWVRKLRSEAEMGLERHTRNRAKE
jgi:hypothetical protein